MDREAARILMPFTTTSSGGGGDANASSQPHQQQTGMNKSQKGRKSPSSSSCPSLTSAGEASVKVGGRRIRLRILGVILITVIPVFAVLVVVLMALLLLYTVAGGVPNFYLAGNLTGVVNASLGSLGHAVLTPNLTLAIKVSL